MSIERSNFAGLLFVLLLADTARAYQDRSDLQLSGTTGYPTSISTQPSIAATPEATPARQPEITLRDGMLTVVAENATLRAVLSGIQRAAGIVVEMPPNVDERVVLQLGPGSPREILTALMNGGKFNYVIISSLERPDVIDRLILTPRQELGADVSPTRKIVVMPSIVSPPPPAPDDGGETAANTVEKKGDSDQPVDGPDEPESPQ